MKTIVWFRQDLRISDNPALLHACAQGEIIPVFIQDHHNARQQGAASDWWLHHSLTSLNASLEDRLQIYQGSSLKVLKELCDQYGATQVVWNRLYEPAIIKRDTEIKESLHGSGITVKSFNGRLLWEPMQILKKDQTPYKVFTPYYRKGCLQAQPPRTPNVTPKDMRIIERAETSMTVGQLKLLPLIDWCSEFSQHWNPGEEGAKDKLQNFIKNAAQSYKRDRNIPDIQGTSRLSPHLHFGEMSPNQIWYAILDNLDPNDEDIDCYLSELGWREFSHYLLFHFFHMEIQNFNAKFNHFPWKKDENLLTAWQKGLTGIPIVDAGMRELRQTGYMHNRVRMIVGSFLVKNLLLDWREGEAWFWDCLLDADLAANVASWQWVAGSGADAAPYFRIFNPVTQGQRFDENGEYVKRYCPELKKLPPKFIHDPWNAKPDILRACGVELGNTYPKPLVDLKTSRQEALDAFQVLKQV
ncbi:MAG: deoxyribodipyrimidine photo-lyase [Alteromonadaceae bacterium]|nr:deoxyribodipyrimidine photo-lyase [Alteromonadaceae bacterium]